MDNCNRIKNILLPVTFSASSLNRVNSAASMCKRHDATLHLLHVLEPAHPFPRAGMEIPDAALGQEIGEGKKNNLNFLAEAVRRKHGIRCIAHCAVGSLTHHIALSALRTDSNLVIIGINPKPSKPLIWTDSTAFSVMRLVNCPVMTIPDGKRVRAFRNILFPVRPLEHSLEKYSFLRSIVSANKSHVHLLGAVDRKRKEEFNAARELISEMKSVLRADGVKKSYELHLRPNIPETLLDAGRQHSADLVVIRANTKRNFRQFFTGNFMQKMINNPHLPVLCVN